MYHSVVGGTSKILANNINSEVSRLMKSCGVKTRLDSSGKDYFAVIRETNDADFIKANYKKLAEAYFFTHNFYLSFFNFLL